MEEIQTRNTVGVRSTPDDRNDFHNALAAVQNRINADMIQAVLNPCLPGTVTPSPTQVDHGMIMIQTITTENIIGYFIGFPEIDPKTTGRIGRKWVVNPKYSYEPGEVIRATTGDTYTVIDRATYEGMLYVV